MVENVGTISIVVCSFNRREMMERLVGSLLRMRRSWDAQIVVVEETDMPVDIEGAVYVSHPVRGRGIPYARNLALRHCSGEIIVFIDDDCRPADHWLEALLSPFEDQSVVGVQGGVSVPEDGGAIGWAETLLGFPGGGVRRIIQSSGEIQTTREVSTLNCAYRRWVIDRIGGFDERLEKGGEDYVLAKSAIQYGRCVFSPAALVTHMPRGTFGAIWRWFVRRGVADVTMMSLNIQTTRTFRHQVRDSVSTKMLLLAVLFLLLPHGWILFPISAAVYVVLQCKRYYPSWRKTPAGTTALIILPFVKLTMDMAMDWGRFKTIAAEKLRPRLRHQ